MENSPPCYCVSNIRKHNSFVIFSDYEGLTWYNPKELSAALTSSRHFPS